MRRLVLAAAIAAGAVAPAAHAFIQYCVVYPQQGHDVYVCHMPERPGCVYGSLGEEADFHTQQCD